MSINMGKVTKVLDQNKDAENFILNDVLFETTEEHGEVLAKAWLDSYIKVNKIKSKYAKKLVIKVFNKVRLTAEDMREADRIHNTIWANMSDDKMDKVF